MLDRATLRKYIPQTLAVVDLDWPFDQERGKVRDWFTLPDDRRAIVTTDRLSAFDMVLTTIPFKGQVLNQLSAFWFERTADLIPNHIIGVPDPNVSLVRDCEPLPVEVVVRGYIAGVTKTALWYRYSLGERHIYGYDFSDGLKKNEPLPEPIITPTTKGRAGEHDERITCAEVVERGLLDAETWKQIQAVALAIFKRGQEIARQGGLILVDTKEVVERPALCIFEYIYFARPDSLLEGRSVHWVRRRLGERLAQEHPVDADMVIGVPDSATSHTIGYANVSGIPFGEGLIKNRYIGRTFIQPDDRLRRLGVAPKFNPLTDLRGKRIVLVDDSIVRGNTSGAIVALLRQAGAAEIHMRVASPPLRHPCFMGVDMSTREELIAAGMNVDEIASHLGVDSLGYLSLEGMIKSVGPGERDHCRACFTGEYPAPNVAGMGKEMFEPG